MLREAGNSIFSGNFAADENILSVRKNSLTQSQDNYVTPAERVVFGNRVYPGLGGEIEKNSLNCTTGKESFPARRQRFDYRFCPNPDLFESSALQFCLPQGFRDRRSPCAAGQTHARQANSSRKNQLSWLATEIFRSMDKMTSGIITE